MAPPRGILLSPRHCLTIKLYRDRTAVLQRDIAERCDMTEVRFSQIINRHRPASRFIVGRVERFAEALLMSDPDLEEAVEALLRREEKKPIDEDKLISELRSLPENRKLAALHKVGQILQTIRG